MLISPAYAQAAGGEPSALVSLLPLVLIFVVFYFLLIRPQQKKMKQHREMVAAVRRGDKVVTAGGLIGTVTKVIDDSTVQIELAENVKVKAVKGTLSEVLSKSEPAEGGKTPPPANDAGGGAGNGKSNFSLGSLFGGKPKS